jgi:hypothetical protein
MSMPIERDRGYTVGNNDHEWLACIPEEKLFKILIMRLDVDKAAYCRGYLDALFANGIVGYGEATAIFEEVRKPHWCRGWRD